MIIVEDKSIEKVYYFPKNEDDGNAMLLQLFSELTHLVTTFQVENIANNRLYYGFSLDFSDVADGEYQYSIIDEYNEILEKGIIRIGDYSSGDVIYDLKEEYYVYNPELGDVEVVEEVGCSEKINEAYAKGYADGYEAATPAQISLETDSEIPNTADTISYLVNSTKDWTLKYYVRHHKESEWTLIRTEEHTERGSYNGTIEIGENVTDYPKHFKLEVYANNASDSKEIEQDMTIYFDVDVYSASSALSWDATEMSYGIQYSAYQSVHTGTFYIYKNGELYLEQPFGWYPYGFSTYCEIPANSGETPVTWTITGILDNGQQDSCTVIQDVKTERATRLTFEMLEDGDIEWEGRGYEYYDIIRDGVRDEGNQLDHGVFDLKAGDIVEFYLMTDNTNPFSTSITSTAKHKVYGNVMSLYFADFESVSATTMEGQFSNLFKDDTNLTDAENLVFPACGNMYEFVSMFEGCTSLVNAPKTLYGDFIGAHTCDSMFKGCTSLIKAPILPATTLGVYAYWRMFEGCTSLVNAPSLPATNLSPVCYSGMFSGCTSLVNAPELPATTLFFDCYANMFNGCTSLVNAPALPATTLADECYYTMFGYCTSLVNAPELPATTLVDRCYMQMFYGCSSLNYIKCNATDISANACTKNWAYMVSQTGTFVKNPNMNSWDTGDNGIPSNWTVENIE